jgi:hypothetical protein
MSLEFFEDLFFHRLPSIYRFLSTRLIFAFL